MSDPYPHPKGEKHQTDDSAVAAKHVDVEAKEVALVVISEISLDSLEKERISI